MRVPTNIEIQDTVNQGTVFAHMKFTFAFAFAFEKHCQGTTHIFKCVEEGGCIGEKVTCPICGTTIHCKSAKSHYSVIHSQGSREEVAGESGKSASVIRLDTREYEEME
ncbi:hypothetical protein BGZ76_002598 [Entomortierella beljakovae]|nr:hypothetical protein BGZ76_002598 [Entomortierella beljakovae]